MLYTQINSDTQTISNWRNTKPSSNVYCTFIVCWRHIYDFYNSSAGETNERTLVYTCIYCMFWIVILWFSVLLFINAPRRKDNRRPTAICRNWRYPGCVNKITRGFPTGISIETKLHIFYDTPTDEYSATPTFDGNKWNKRIVRKYKNRWMRFLLELTLPKKQYSNGFSSYEKCKTWKPPNIA